MLTLMFGLAMALGSIDQGIYPELAAKVQIEPPDWPVESGPLRLRLDPQHRLLTLYQGGVALTAYGLVTPPPAGLSSDYGRAALLSLLSPADAQALRQRIAGRAAVPLLIGPPPAYQDRDGDGVVNTLDVLIGAKKLGQNRAHYRGSYRVLGYPGGDVPRSEGVCTDTLVRALRNAGWDLQRGVHEDALRRPQLYPLSGKAPDANIDHRRIRMLLPWLRQIFVELPAAAPYLPGDLVLFDTFPRQPGPDHAGIVSDRLGPSGQPLIVNNWTDGYVEQEMDLLRAVPVTHRFRAPMAPLPTDPPLRP